MDKRNIKKSATMEQNDYLVHITNQLKSYEQRMIEYMRSQEITLERMNDTVKTNSEDLKLLESSLLKRYEYYEVVEVYKIDFLNGINNIKIVGDEINHLISNTFDILTKIGNISASAENIIKDMQAKINAIECKSNKELANIQQRLNLLQVNEAKECDEHEIILAGIEKDCCKTKDFLKHEEAESEILINEKENLENDFLKTEIELDNLHKYLVQLKQEIEFCKSDVANLEEKMKLLKDELNEIKLSLNECCESELNLKNHLHKIQNEIATIIEDNSKLNEHEVMHLLDVEEKLYQNKIQEVEDKVNSLARSNSLINDGITQEKYSMDKLNEEISTYETKLATDIELLEEINKQIQKYKNIDTLTHLNAAKEELKITFDNIIHINAKVENFKSHVIETEQKLDAIPTVSDEDINNVSQETASYTKISENELVNIDIKTEEFTKKMNTLRKEKQTDRSNKITKLVEIYAELDEKIEELRHSEKPANASLRAILVECDVFAKRLKDTKEMNHNLRKQINDFKNPAVQKERQKRKIDEISNASSDTAWNFSNIKDVQKYMKQKYTKST